MESFTDLTKNARFEELREELAPQLSVDWDWPRLRALLDALGVVDPGGFLAAGWWLPAEVRVDQNQVEAYAREAERAIAEGALPEPGGEYTWEHVRTLLARCDIAPGQVAEGLLWAYANTLGEQAFGEALRRVTATPPA